MTQDDHPPDAAEWTDLDPRTATLSGILVACIGLAVLVFAWWPLWCVFRLVEKHVIDDEIVLVSYLARTRPYEALSHAGR